MLLEGAGCCSTYHAATVLVPSSKDSTECNKEVLIPPGRH